MGQILSPLSQQQVLRQDDPENIPASRKFPGVRYKIKNSNFIQAMSVFVSRTRLEVGDNRWNHLFNSELLLELMENPYCLAEYALRLLQNNPTSQNFLQLIEQVMSNMKYAMKKKTGFADAYLPQCCMAIFLTTNLFHFFFMFLSSEELRNQLNLGADWPDKPIQQPIAGTTATTASTTTGSGGETPAVTPQSNTIENLIDTLIEMIAAPCDELTDLKFFSMELLITLLSCAMYRNTMISPDDHVVTDDLFLVYVLQLARNELQHSRLVTSLAYDPNHASGASNASFGECRSVKLLKGLLQCSLGGVVTYVQASVANPDGSTSTVVQRRIPIYSPAGFLSNLQFRYITHRSGYDTEMQVVAAVQRVFTDVYVRVNRWLRPDVPIELPDDVPSGADVFEDGLVPDQIFPIHLLKDRSLQLLLLLLHVRMDDQVTVLNPFREVFSLLVDDRISHQLPEGSDGDVEMAQRPGTGALAVNKIRVDFYFIVSELVNLLPSKEYGLALYSLLQMIPSFPSIIVRTGKSQALIEACLRGLHEAVTTDPEDLDIDTINHLYTLVLCLLQLAQDSTFMTSLVPQAANGADNVDDDLEPIQLTYYKELSQLSLTPLEAMVAVAIKVLALAVYKLNDPFLISNLAAFLLHLAPYLTQLQAPIAERVVRLMVGLCKRVVGGGGPTSTRTVSDVSDIDLVAAPAVPATPPADDPFYTPPVATGPSIALLHLGLVSLLGFTHSVLPKPNGAGRSEATVSFLHALVVAQADINFFLKHAEIRKLLANPKLLNEIGAVGTAVASSATGASGVNVEGAVELDAVAPVIDHVHSNRKEAVSSAISISIAKAIPALQYSEEVDNVVSHQLTRLEEVIRARGGDGRDLAYLTADQTLEVLREEAVRASSPVPVAIAETSTEKDLESPTKLSTASPSPASAPLPNLDMVQFAYQEAENAQDFFVPYIWTTILLSTPELPWNWEKLSRAHLTEEI